MRFLFKDGENVWCGCQDALAGTLWYPAFVARKNVIVSWIDDTLPAKNNGDDHPSASFLCLHFWNYLRVSASLNPLWLQTFTTFNLFYFYHLSLFLMSFPAEPILYSSCLLFCKQDLINSFGKIKTKGKKLVVRATVQMLAIQITNWEERKTNDERFQSKVTNTWIKADD